MDLSFLAYSFAIYIFIKIYISIMQIGFISQKITEEPIILSSDNFIKAGQYAISKERINIISTIVEYFIFLFWIFYGFKLSSEIFNQQNLIFQTIFIFSFFIIGYIINLPFEIYQKFILDQKYGFNKSTYKLYFIDQIKTFMLAIIFGFPVVYSILYFIENIINWWLYSAIFLITVITLVNILYPVFIPLFNKLTPLENGELKIWIEKVIKSTGFNNNGIFVIDASKRDGRLNAFFGGFGKSKIVVLYDTLIAKLTHSEIIAVIGHELGHFTNNDNYKNLLMISSFVFLFFYVADYLSLSKNGSGEFLIILSIYLSISLFFISPIFSYIYRKHEFKADKFGSEISGSSLFLSEALKKLVSENSSFPISHPIYRFFYETHPSVSERLEKLKK